MAFVVDILLVDTLRDAIALAARFAVGRKRSSILPLHRINWNAVVSIRYAIGSAASISRNRHRGGLVMPRSLTSGSVPSQELRHFTNREQERHVLSRLLALPSGQPVPVVMFYGVGGTGKSWLLRRSRRSTAGNPVGLARLRSTVRRRSLSHRLFAGAGRAAATVCLGRVPALRCALQLAALSRGRQGGSASQGRCKKRKMYQESFIRL